MLIEMRSRPSARCSRLRMNVDAVPSIWPKPTVPRLFATTENLRPLVERLTKSSSMLSFMKPSLPAHDLAGRKRSAGNTNWFRERRSHGCFSVAFRIASDRLGPFIDQRRLRRVGSGEQSCRLAGTDLREMRAQRNKARYGRYNARRSRLLVSPRQCEVPPALWMRGNQMTSESKSACDSLHDRGLRARRKSRGLARNLRPPVRLDELRAGGARLVHGRGNTALVSRPRHRIDQDGMQPLLPDARADQIRRPAS